MNILHIIISDTVFDSAIKTLKGQRTNIRRKRFEPDVFNTFVRRGFKDAKFYK